MKFKSTRYLFSILASVAFLCLAAAVPAKAGNDPATPTKNIIETAVEAGSFTILTKAVESAGLKETLKYGNYTVFAPTDEAFKALPPGTLDALLSDKVKLKKVLMYHVVEGRQMADEVARLSEINTAAGIKAPLKVKGDKVKIAGARIVKTDIAATNGVIHVINKVMIPSE
jgi:uncharacterized surface protein with fasciclin (FAS1) repeats